MLRAMYRVILIVVLGACTPFSPDLGEAPYTCTAAAPRCPEGYTCQQSVCVDEGGGSPGVDARPSVDAGRDASGVCASPFSGVLATWTLTGQSGSQASTAGVAGTTSITAGALQRSATLVPGSGANSINSSGWSTGGLDQTKYYTVTLSAPGGCSISVSELALDITASGTGPTSAEIGTSADAFATTTPASTTAPGNVGVTASTTSNMIEIRVFGVGASSTMGTMRIQNTLSVTGALQ